MTHQELWAAYKAVNPDAGDEYGAWAYGDDPRSEERRVGKEC